MNMHAGIVLSDIQNYSPNNLGSLISRAPVVAVQQWVQYWVARGADERAERGGRAA